MPVIRDIHFYLMKLFNFKKDEDEKYKKLDLNEFITRINVKYLKIYFENNQNLSIIKEENQEKVNLILSPFCANKNLFLKNFKVDNNNSINYPLLFQILNESDNFKTLQEFSSINDLPIKLLNYFNYKKSPKEIQETEISKERDNIIFYTKSAEINQSTFNKIIAHYMEFISSILGMEIKKKTDEDPLINYLLVENKDKNINPSLYEVYEKMIKFQNDIIEKIFNEKGKEIHKDYFDKINTGILIQDANNSNIFKLIDEDKFIQIIINNSYKKYKYDNDNILYDNNYRRYFLILKKSRKN